MSRPARNYHWDDVATVLNRGRSADHLARSFGLTSRSFERVAFRQNRPDVATLIARGRGLAVMREAHWTESWAPSPRLTTKLKHSQANYGDGYEPSQRQKARRSQGQDVASHRLQNRQRSS